MIRQHTKSAVLRPSSKKIMQQNSKEITFLKLRDMICKMYIKEIFEHNFIIINFTTDGNMEDGELILLIVNKNIVGIIASLDFVTNKTTLDGQNYYYHALNNTKELMEVSKSFIIRDPYVGITWLRNNIFLIDQNGIILDEEVRKKFEKLEQEGNLKIVEENVSENLIDENDDLN